LMQVGQSHSWIDTALATVFIFFYQVAESAYRTFEISTERLEPILKAFKELHPESQ